MKVVTFMNEKGGVGKTTLAVTLSAGLSILGNRVLLIDTDPQANATIALGLNRENGFFNLMANGASWQDVIGVVPAERYTIPDEATEVTGVLAVVPSAIQSRVVLGALESESMFSLLSRMVELDGVFDYIIFDTSPTPSLLHTMIQTASDGVIYPTELEFFGLDGLNETLKRRLDVNKMRRAEGLRDLTIYGIVPNRTRLSTVEHAEKMKLLIDNFGRELVYRPIPQRTVWAEANAARRTVFGFDPTSSAYKEAWTFVKQFMRVSENV